MRAPGRPVPWRLNKTDRSRRTVCWRCAAAGFDAGLVGGDGFVTDVSLIKAERLVADSVYGSAEMLNSLLHERGIEPHIPIFAKSERSDGTFERADFTYNHQADAPLRPAGKQLRQIGRANVCTPVTNPQHVCRLQ